ncbi:hypothetical protein J2X07_000477 [Fictibacillus barbaricus]|uniref:Uncharacterized protein n=1 Tax=Fictibacillus barbaricus TaxID=182136 RepID=A0ABU1TWC2_9BACL|nr:hypothetical protein [Fictibacillus barbaricus]
MLTTADSEKGIGCFFVQKCIRLDDEYEYV